jgi:hypothetical protein
VVFSVIKKENYTEEYTANLPMVDAGWEDYWDNPSGSPVLPDCQFYMLGWYRASNADKSVVIEMEEKYGFYERAFE